MSGQGPGLSRWSRVHTRHKARCAGSAAAVLLLAYLTLFLTVACSTSPTDRVLRLGDGREVAFSQWGSGEASRCRVVLVHGAPTDASSWNRFRETASAAVRDVEWIAIDRLGYGNSSSADELSLDQHAEALRPLVAEAPEGGVILVGHSYGGPVVLRAAAMLGSRVRGIVLVAGACDGDMEDAQWFRRAVDSISAVVPEPWARANRELLALTDENDRIREELDRITCPVVVVHGTWDPVCPYEGTVAYLQRHLVNAAAVDIVALERAGHNLHLSHPEEIAAAVEAILAKSRTVR